VVYNCILVGFDGSEASRRAVEKAAMIARRLDARLLVVTVVPGPSVLLGELLLPEVFPTEDIIKAAREGLDKLAEEIKEKYNINVDTLVVEGDAAEGLLETAKSNSCSLIVVGRRGRGLAEKLLGSVSSKLVNIARGVDVLVVEPGETRS